MNTVKQAGRNFKDYLLLAFKGMGMGAADVVPGVSGGTIAFITNIYEELINSIRSVDVHALKLLFTGKFSAFWKWINGSFLLSVLTGIAISIFSLARGLGFLLDHYPILVWSFFFGLIVASAIYVGRSIRRWSAGAVIAGVGGALIAYLITILSPAEANATAWFIFLSGSIAICAMILPGISGSFILVLLGMYTFILDAVSTLDAGILLIFIAGAATGIILFSHLLSWLLKKFHHYTIAVLTGFMVGSLNKVWPWKKVTDTFTGSHGEVKPLVEKNIWPGTYEQVTGHDAWLPGAIILALTGFFLIFILEGYTKPKNSKQ